MAAAKKPAKKATRPKARATKAKRPAKKTAKRVGAKPAKKRAIYVTNTVPPTPPKRGKARA